MKRLADHEHPRVQEMARKLTRGKSTRRDKLRSIFHFVRDEIEFGFPDNGDFVPASQTLRLGIGQCNTKGTLFLALCKASGIEASMHFSLIGKEIQRGYFTGLAYWLVPSLLSHSWIEVEVDGRWHRIDTFISDKPLFDAAVAELKRRGWSTGFALALKNGTASAELNFDRETFQQMELVQHDHGVWDDPADYYENPAYKGRLGPFASWVYRLMARQANRRVKALRARSTGRDKITGTTPAMSAQAT